MIRRWFPLLLAALCATSEAADEPGSADCSLLTAAAYGTVPLLFYEDRADSLLQLLDDWEAVCGPTEAIQRTRILGAIWDGAFAEDLYGTEIMEDLVQRGAEFRDGSMATPVRAAYDSFTVELADQLLPHQPAGTPE